MATASGNSEGTRKPVKPSALSGVAPVVAYAVVLALLAVAGVIVFVAGSGGKAGAPVRDTASRPAVATDIEAARTARGLKLPPRPASVEAAPAEKTAPEKTASEKTASEKTALEKMGAAAVPAKPEPNPAPSSSPAQAEPDKKPEPLKIETAKAEPGKAACKVDLTRWPTEKSDQAQAVQMMLRDLGYYRGTTNGTVGPQTRTAIREFQTAAGEGETGEIGEALFEALKKKCAASP